MVIACVLGLGGCSGLSTQDAAPVTSAAPLRSSGPLADGFEIEPGSRAVGGLFPVAPTYGGGREAVLRVDGDLQLVFAGYVQQAEELGFVFESEVPSSGQRCSDPDDEGASNDPPGPVSLSCGASGVRPDDSEVSLSGLADPDGIGYIRLRTGEPAEASTPSPLSADAQAAQATDVELAPGFSVRNDRPPLRVVEGSTLQFGPYPVNCGNGGFMVMLQVPGHLMRVMRGYEEEFASAGFNGQGLVEDQDGLILVTSTGGGGILTAVAVAGEPSYVLIEHCSD